MVHGRRSPSRKKRLSWQSSPPVDPLAAADHDLRRMERWIAYSRPDGELWVLLTLDAISAHAALETAGEQAPAALRRLFETVMESFRAETSTSGTSSSCERPMPSVMGLWRSGIDPTMVPRLTAYLNKPTESGAKEFLKYQGPELYRPLCNEAAKS
jgi:hypothetical protein